MEGTFEWNGMNGLEWTNGMDEQETNDENDWGSRDRSISAEVIQIQIWFVRQQQQGVIVDRYR